MVIRLGRAPVVVPVSPPKDPLNYSAFYRTGKNPNKATLTGVAYKSIMHRVLLGTGNVRDGSMQRPRRPINLLHDRDPAHTSHAFRDWAAAYNINAVLLPPRSPDLDPLDYGVFGAAQRSLDSELERSPLSFQQQCAHMRQRIEQTNTDAAFAALPGRITRCIAARGWHFE